MTYNVSIQFRRRRRRKSQVIKRITQDEEFLSQIRELKYGLDDLKDKMASIKEKRRRHRQRRLGVQRMKELEKRNTLLIYFLLGCSRDGVVMIIIRWLLVRLVGELKQQRTTI